MVEDDLPLPGAFVRLTRILSHEANRAIQDTLDTIKVQILPPDPKNLNGTVTFQMGAQFRSVPLDEALSKLPLDIRQAVVAAVRGAPRPEKALSFDVLYKDAGISNRLYNCMKRSKIDTLGAASRLSEAQLYEIYGLGSKGINELRRVLDKYGFALPDH